MDRRRNPDKGWSHRDIDTREIRILEVVRVRTSEILKQRKKSQPFVIWDTWERSGSHQHIGGWEGKTSRALGVAKVREIGSEPFISGDTWWRLSDRRHIGYREIRVPKVEGNGTSKVSKSQRDQDCPSGRTRGSDQCHREKPRQGSHPSLFGSSGYR
jgi:hypothetical protein